MLLTSDIPLLLWPTVFECFFKQSVNVTGSIGFMYWLVRRFLFKCLLNVRNLRLPPRCKWHLRYLGFYASRNGKSEPNSGTVYGFGLHGSSSPKRSSWTAWPFKMGLIGCHENLVRNWRHNATWNPKITQISLECSFLQTAFLWLKFHCHIIPLFFKTLFRLNVFRLHEYSSTQSGPPLQHAPMVVFSCHIIFIKI